MSVNFQHRETKMRVKKAEVSFRSFSRSPCTRMHRGCWGSASRRGRGGNSRTPLSPWISRGFVVVGLCCLVSHSEGFVSGAGLSSAGLLLAKQGERRGMPKSLDWGTCTATRLAASSSNEHESVVENHTTELAIDWGEREKRRLLYKDLFGEENISGELRRVNVVQIAKGQKPHFVRRKEKLEIYENLFSTGTCSGDDLKGGVHAVASGRAKRASELNLDLSDNVMGVNPVKLGFINVIPDQ